METNKKFIISLTAVAVVAVAAIVSLVVVLAAFTVTTTNDFKISYTAKGVEATVTAQYKLASVTDGSGSYTIIQSSAGENSIAFDRQATGTSITQSFKALSNVQITKDKFFVLKYTIANTSGDVAISVAVDIPGTPDNFTRGYVYSSTSTDPTTKAPASITTTDTFATQTIAAGGTGYIYVVFAIANTDIDASFEGTSTWTLSAV